MLVLITLPPYLGHQAGAVFGDQRHQKRHHQKTGQGDRITNTSHLNRVRRPREEVR